MSQTPSTSDAPGFWDGAEVIHTYGRAQAIDDGVLADLAALVPDEPDFAQQAGWKIPVALTAAVAELVSPTDREIAEEGQDLKGRLWDVLWMAHLWALRNRDVDKFEFPVAFVLADRDGYRAGRKHRATLQLWAGISGDDEGRPVLTIFLPGED